MILFSLWYVDACWYILAAQGHSLFVQLQPGKTFQPVSQGMQVSQACKFRRFGMSCCIIHSDSSFWIHKAFSFMVHTYSWCVSVSFVVAWCNGGPLCLNETRWQRDPKLWPIHPHPFSSRLYYDQWHSRNPPSQEVQWNVNIVKMQRRTLQHYENAMTECKKCCSDTFRAGKIYQRLVHHDVWKIVLSLTCPWLRHQISSQFFEIWSWESASTSECQKVHRTPHVL